MESDLGGLPGLGLLEVETRLSGGKTLSLTKARHLASGLELRGYEIHHGLTSPLNGKAKEAVQSEDGRVIGHVSPDGLVFGSYLHGIFDNDAFRRQFIDSLRVR